MLGNPQSYIDIQKINLQKTNLQHCNIFLKFDLKYSKNRGVSCAKKIIERKGLKIKLEV